MEKETKEEKKLKTKQKELTSYSFCGTSNIFWWQLQQHFISWIKRENASRMLCD